MLDAYLQRSKNMPLTLWIFVDINHYLGHDTSSLHLVFDLMDHAFSQQHRWEDVRLDISCVGNGWVDPFMLRAPVNRTVDLKKTILLKRMENDIRVLPKGCESQRLVLAQCNGLEKLQLAGDVKILIPNSKASHVPAYLPNLHTLHLQLGVDATWTILGASPNIVDLTLDVEYSGSLPVMRLKPPLSLSKLHSLVLNAWPLLEHIGLPTLTDLKLRQVSFDDGSLFAIAGVLHCFPLKSLALRISSVTEPLSELALDAVLRSSNGLERLSLDFADDDIQRESVFRMLTSCLSRSPPGDQSPALPRLNHLYIKASPSAVLVKDGILFRHWRCRHGMQTAIFVRFSRLNNLLFTVWRASCWGGTISLRGYADSPMCYEGV